MLYPTCVVATSKGEAVVGGLRGGRKGRRKEEGREGRKEIVQNQRE